MYAIPIGSCSLGAADGQGLPRGANLKSCEKSETSAPSVLNHSETFRHGKLSQTTDRIHLLEDTSAVLRHGCFPTFRKLLTDLEVPTGGIVRLGKFPQCGPHPQSSAENDGVRGRRCAEPSIVSEVFYFLRETSQSIRCRAKLKASLETYE